MYIPSSLISLLAILASGTTALGEAVVRHVPDDYPTIDLAVKAAKSGDVVQIATGVYWDNVMIVGKQLSIVAEGDVVVYPATDGPVFTITDLGPRGMANFQGLTITTVVPSGRSGHGLQLELGHGMVIENSTVIIEACRFIDCSVGHLADTADQAGAAIVASSSMVWIDQSWFVNCKADLGGAIACQDGLLDVRESIFVGNNVEYYGGSLFAASVDVSLTQCRFSEGWAMAEGGHMAAFGGTLSLNRCRFSDGWAPDAGAVVVHGYWGEAPSASMEQCRFENNTASAGIDVWKQTAGAGPFMGNATYCGTSGSDGGFLPAWQIPVAESCDACPSDADFDETTDIRDLLDVLEHWGEMDPFTDLTGNGTTGHSDLQMVLYGFGGCLQLM